MATEIYLGNPPENIKKWIKENYKPAFKLTDPLCFTAEEAGSTVKMTKKSSAPTVYLETSTTGEEGSWSEYIVGTTPEIILANVGDKVYFRAKQDNLRFATGSSFYNEFIMKGKIAASGNINTLLKADGSVIDLTGRDFCYYSMFRNCSSLTKAPELPATTLASYCYSYMFTSCASLTSTPELPATTLTECCYYGMFAYCESLIQAPKLPATALADWCYQSMFYDCTDLTQAPALPATTLVDGCYYEMFQGCSSLTQAPELPATTLANRCYSNMFNSCIALTQVPSIAKINNEASFYMFYKAKNLEEITFTHMTTDEVVAIATDACIGIPKGMVVCYCTDGVVIIGAGDDSSGSGS